MTLTIPIRLLSAGPHFGGMYNIQALLCRKCSRRMDFLLALVSPALSKCLEVCFLTGFATSFKLQQAYRKPRGSFTPRGGVPHLPSRKGSPGATRSLPNDPEREGNIWNQYELLEKAHKSLEAQLQEERALHKKELKRFEAQAGQPRSQWRQEDSLHDLPPIKRPEDKTPNELARELSETRSELERLVVEMSDAHNQVEFLQSEKSVLQAENDRLKKASGPTEPRRRTSSSAAKGTPFEEGGPPLNSFSDEAGRGRRGLDGRESMSSFGSDIEFNAHALPGGGRSDTPLKTDRSQGATYKDARLPKHGSQTPPGQAFAGGTVSISKLQEMNKKLVEENQRLQTKMLRLDAPSTVDPDLQEKYNKLIEENTRLQSKVLKLDLGGSPQESSGAEKALATVQAENAELRDDNDKLVNYLEGLEKRKQELEDQVMNNAGGDEKLNAKVEQLTADNAALIDQAEKLKGKLKEANLLNTNGSFTSIPIPVAVDTGDELDKDLWLLVEDLRDQNRTLIEENKQLKGRDGSDLSRTSLDSDSDRGVFANSLVEENSNLQNENLRLTKRLTSSVPAKEQEILSETIRSNERLVGEKEKIVAQMKRMVSRNSRLVADNERLLKQIHSPENISTKSRESLNKADSKGLLSRFSRSLKKKPSKEDKLDSEDESNAEKSVGSVSESVKKGDSPSKQLVQDLLEETSKLSEENKRLATRAELANSLQQSNEQLKAENARLEQSMTTMKELTEDNEKLLKENTRLSLRIEECLSEVKELSASLIDVALQDDEERIEAALGDGKFSNRVSAAKRIDTAAVQQKQADLFRLISFEAEHGAGGAERSKELTSRASKQWQEFESQRSGTSQGLRASLSIKPELSPWGSVMKEGGPISSSQSDDDGEPRLPLGGLRKKEQAQQAKMPQEFDLGSYISVSKLHAEGQENVSQTEAQSAKDKVSRAFYEHCGADDLGSFMKALGYSGFEPIQPDASESQIQDVYQKAMQVTSGIQLAQQATPEAKLLAHCAYEQLQEWFLTYIGG